MSNRLFERVTIYVVGAPLLSSWATAVTSWAGANGFESMMLLGTPLDDQSSALSPLMLVTVAGHHRDPTRVHGRL